MLSRIRIADLALVEWASAMKLTLFMTLLGNLFFPWTVPAQPSFLGLVGGLVALALKIGALTTVLAVVETCVAKLRLFRVPELLAGSFALALLSVTAVVLVR